MILTIFRKGQGKKKPKSMWKKLHYMGTEFKEWEKRIAKKRAWLETRGIKVDTSHIKNPKNEYLENKDREQNKSMWETMQEMDMIYERMEAYQEQIEKIYDDAIAKVKAEGPPSKEEEEKVYTERKVIIDK